VQPGREMVELLGASRSGRKFRAGSVRSFVLGVIRARFSCAVVFGVKRGTKPMTSFSLPVSTPAGTIGLSVLMEWLECEFVGSMRRCRYVSTYSTW